MLQSERKHFLTKVLILKLPVSRFLSILMTAGSKARVLPVLLFCILGCDDSLETFAPDAGDFAVHGYLDPDKPVNAIRVRNLRTPFVGQGSEEGDISVTLTHLESGVVEVLSPVILADDGEFLYNFLVRRDIVYDNAYLLRAEASDGSSREWLARVPVRAEVLANSLPNPDPVACRDTVRVDFAPMNGGTIVVRVGLAPSRNAPWSAPIVLRHESSGGSDGGVGFEFVPLEMVATLTRSTFPVSNCNSLSGGQIYLSYIHYGPGFYDLLVEAADDLRLSTQLFGSAYFDTLGIRVLN
jgi:hypothetical protein